MQYFLMGYRLSFEVQKDTYYNRIKLKMAECFAEYEQKRTEFTI